MGRAVAKVQLTLFTQEVITGVFFVIEFFIFFGQWILDHHEAIRNIGLVLVGLIGAPILVWRTLIASLQAKTSQAQVKISQEQLLNVQRQVAIANKNHITDTYSQAIEHLGATNNEGKPVIEQRLGALYTLEKIAQANADYHPQIMEILSAYIRFHSPLPTNKKELNSDQDETSPAKTILRLDIQACLTIIGRRKIFNDTSCIDLSNINLTETNLTEVDLTGTNLSSTSGLTLTSLKSAKNWEKSIRDNDLLTDEEKAISKESELIE